MKNTVNFASTVDAIYALSSLKSVINDPTLPGPIGRNEEDSLRALAQRTFYELCAEIGAETDGQSVDLPRDCHELIQAIVNDRTLAELTMRNPRSDLMRRLRCRMRPVPPKNAKRY